MKSYKFISLFLFGTMFFGSSCSSQDDRVDRQPAVAGQFYPEAELVLKNTLEQLFLKAKPKQNENNIIAIISPHAGYIYSGQVAASAFNQIYPSRKYDNIFILGSSHQIAFDGASIYTKGDFVTPLGKVKVNTELANELINNHSVFSNRTDAHEREHSLEVQLPFLQYRMKEGYKIVPIIIGSQSIETSQRVAAALKPYFNSNNLFIVSTDFSHYPKYDDAYRVDKETADAILTNSSKNLLHVLAKYKQEPTNNLVTCLCGWTSVLTLLYITEENPDITFAHIQYLNSGDTEHAGKERVVGYSAISISLKEEKDRTEFFITDKDKKALLDIARSTITHFLQDQKKPVINETNLSAVLKTKCGAFVTLKKHGDLRGCVGRFDASEPLYKIVQEMAVASSTYDRRFSPVQKNEISDLEIEISVLTPMQRIRSIEEFQLGKHGIYIRKGNKTGTFLPQVAEETGWTKEEFLGHCSQDKAGIGWNGWKDADLYVYEALVFGEINFPNK